MDAWIKIATNVATIVTWALTIAITMAAIVQGKKLGDKSGISIKKYLFCMAITEVLYTIGSIMVLSAMGVNVVQHLASLDIWKAHEIVGSLNATTIKTIGIFGWIGFAINAVVVFLSPVYVIVAGGKDLHPYFKISAWTEIVLEIITTIMIFVSLQWG